MNIYCDIEEFIPELKNVVRMFVPFLDSSLDFLISRQNGYFNCVVGDKLYYCRLDPAFSVENTQKDQTQAYLKEQISAEFAESINRNEIKNGLMKEYKIATYKALSHHFRRKLPWGSLTGIRPSRIVYKALSENMQHKDAIKLLRKKYLVSAKKANLVKEIIKNQEGFLFNHNEYVNLYVHIPFCPSRCNYCSFVSLDANKYADLIEPYLEQLIREIRLFKSIKSKKVLSIYIGGGTPTVLNPQQLFRLLQAVDELNPKHVEYTVEAGRPDTITRQKLQILKSFFVTRISVNPQTFCEKTLEKIGRNHKMSDVFEAFELSRKYDFDINMDLIAGLNDETVEDFTNTISKAIELAPENITIHTLSIKNGSNNFLNDRKFNSDTLKMTEIARKSLTKAGYLPYYLYRQKNITDNLENTGYTIANRQNIFNITSMEETVSVVAFGAGGISKIVTDKSIERFANLRDVKLYIENFEQMREKKHRFLSYLLK